MQRFKLVGVMFGALFALAMMASSASAFTLPDLSLTLSGTYPVHAQGTLPGAETKLGSATGIPLEGKGVTLLLLATGLSSLGTFTSTFTKVKIPAGEECETTGAGKGNVISSGEYHIVPLNTTGTIGLLFLVTQFLIDCPKNTFVIKGNLISSINAGTENQELTTFGGVLEGSKGKQTISEYINDTGSKIKAKLEVEVNKSGEFVGADENVVGELPLEVLGSKMIVITGR